MLLVVRELKNEVEVLHASTSSATSRSEELEALEELVQLYRRIKETELDEKQECNFALYLVDFSIKLRSADRLEESLRTHHESLALVSRLRNQNVKARLSQ